MLIHEVDRTRKTHGLGIRWYVWKRPIFHPNLSLSMVLMPSFLAAEIQELCGGGSGGGGEGGEGVSVPATEPF